MADNVIVLSFVVTVSQSEDEDTDQSQLDVTVTDSVFDAPENSIFDFDNVI